MNGTAKDLVYLLNMEIGEQCEIAPFTVYRVPNGWIYMNYLRGTYQQTFVPDNRVLGRKLGDIETIIDKIDTTIDSK